MSVAERKKFYNGLVAKKFMGIVLIRFYFNFLAQFDGEILTEEEEEEKAQTQTQVRECSSAMFMVWNLIADLVETGYQNENEQQQIIDFYAKANSTFPRLACLMQMYMNACSIFDQIKDIISFDEGDSNDVPINERFIQKVEEIIKSQFHYYDKTYNSLNEFDHMNQIPLVIVGKDAVVAAWKWYEHYLNIASALFTIDYGFTSKVHKQNSSPSNRNASLKQLIMNNGYNIFPLSTITDKHPVTGQT